MLLIFFWDIGDFLLWCLIEGFFLSSFWDRLEATAISVLSIAFSQMVLSIGQGSMDLIGKCKERLTYFRIKELKDVLTQLNLAKQGKKQDLVDRILALLSDEQVQKSQLWGKRNAIGKNEVAKIIEDTYRKMQAPAAADLASRSPSSSDFNHVKPKEEVVDSYELEMKVRCHCGSSLMTESMIQCEDRRCRVWQHIGCVILPEKPLDGASLELPPQFYCELCRISRADPFWQTMGHPLLPIKLASSVVASDGTSTILNEDRTFQLSRADRELLQKSEYDLQAWCLLLNDKVQFRMQWPQHVEFQVNGVLVRVVARQGSQLLGINGRDDGAVITTYSREGINRICLSRSDARVFCIGIRLVKWRTVQQVLNMVPKEQDGESFEDALSRVRRCVGGGAALENADSDSDIEVVADSITVNLRCPMSGSRIKIAGRFRPCVHMGCFDLETFVELNQRSRKWQCPICLKNYSLENMIIDSYFNRITSMLRNCGEDVNEIDVKPDGSWRAKNEIEVRDLAKWHLPDGSLCPIADVEMKPDLEKLREIKQEVIMEGHQSLKLGIKRNRNGVWEVSKSSGNHVLPKFENDCQNILPMSSSATGSFREGEDPSVNQDVAGNFELSLNNGSEPDSFPLNFDTIYNANVRISPPPLKGQDVIVLSDSEEDYANTPAFAYETPPVDNNGVHFPSDPGVQERYPEDPEVGVSGTSCLGLFSNNADDYGMPIWPTQTCPQTGPGFQLFGEETDAQDALVDPHGSVGCTPDNGYAFTADNGLGDNSHVQDLFTGHPDTELNGSLVDNPLAFSGEDPSLQIFLPSRPAGAPLQSDLSDRAEMTNGIHYDDWISLRLAAGGDPNEPVPADGLNHKRQAKSRESRIEPLDDPASLLLSMNNNRSHDANPNTKRSVNSLAHAQQARSVRPRLYLSIDSDSD